MKKQATARSPIQVPKIKWRKLRRNYYVSQIVNINKRIDSNLLAWRLVGEEKGGGIHVGFGQATVICNGNGDPLKPFYIHKSVRPLKVQALFTTAMPVLIEVTVDRLAKRDVKNIIITLKKYHIDKLSGDVTTDVMFEKRVRDDDIIEKIPLSLNNFTEAILAAYDKSHCFRCREPHFISKSLPKNIKITKW
ncbi:MAG: hypothetical protein ACTSRA_00740 [Promethearchaeota archaeon]|nr:MAG: hypothetical protein [Helarchaeota virus Nidhogg Meg22_1012]URC17307.1 MAG: hypothetical protein [Helarchaeota virus Nidhogg Meg22_1214]